MRIIEQFHIALLIPTHPHKLAIELFIVRLIHPRRAEADSDLARCQRFGLHGFQRRHVLLVFGMLRGKRLCPFEFGDDLPRKVFLRSDEARILIFRAHLFGVAEHRIAEFRKDGFITLSREFLDIGNIDLPPLVLTDLQCLKRVVRRGRYGIRAYGTLGENIRLCDRLGLLVHVLARKQQRAVAVVLEELAVRLAVEIAVPPNE